MDDKPPRPETHVVKLVPDIPDVHLFSKAHGEIIHSSVLKQLSTIRNPDIKFEFCNFERGRYKFACLNETAKNWAMNVVPSLTNLWKDPKN